MIRKLPLFLSLLGLQAPIWGAEPANRSACRFRHADTRSKPWLAELQQRPDRAAR
jgi:hypothetical protein